MNRSGTSLAMGIGLLIAAAVIVDAVFTGRKPWDIVLAVARGESPPKASGGTGSVAPSATGTAAASPNTGIGNLIGGTKAAAAIAFAMAHIGADYSTAVRFGPNSFDCSGLIYAAAKAAGVTVGSNSYEQATNGANVPLAPQYVRPGDLIFYYGDSPARNLGHVAMAISSTQQIAAPHTGSKVQIQPIRWTDPGPNSRTGVQLIRRVF